MLKSLGDDHMARAIALGTQDACATPGTGFLFLWHGLSFNGSGDGVRGTGHHPHCVVCVKRHGQTCRAQCWTTTELPCGDPLA